MKNKSTSRRKALGKRVQQFRKSKGWSQEVFASHANLDRSYTGGIERGERNITFDTICLIAEALDISLSELFEGI